MNRRKLIRKLSAAVPALFLLPSILASCRKDLILPENTYKGDVIIIGAGAAGVYAAHLLQKYGVKVQILEASNKAGGRILSEDSLFNYSLELGADRIKGKRSILYDLAAFHAADSLMPLSGTNLFLFDGDLRSEYYLRENAGLLGGGASLFQIIDSFASYPGTEQSVAKYLNDFPIDHRLPDIANALIGNDLGADNSVLGMMAMKERASMESSGRNEFILKNKSLWSLFETAFTKATEMVLSQKVVNQILYKQDRIIVKTNGGDEFSAGRVLITVPLGVLKKNMIQFDPPLPASKLSTIDRIGFGQGLRVALRFSQPFWTDDTDKIMGGKIAPYYEISSKYRSENQYVVTATVMGNAAEELKGLADSVIISKIIAELSQFYHSGGVAAKFTQQYRIQNWSEEPYILGSYSYPTLNSSGMHQVLAAPVAGKLFFAGEATNFNGHSGTVHGAMESAYRAVEEILKS